VLVTHGYTSSHHAADHNPANGNQPGWWDGLIGPGKAIDTDKLFVVASNMLGSSYGSTNGASIDPRSGKPYGSAFPAITVRDIVGAQKALLDSLGMRHLVAVAGPSYGGYQALQWAVAYPEMMDAIAAIVTAPRSQNAEKSLAELEARFATDPEWHGGDYYGHGGAKSILTQMRFETLMRYGYNEQLAGRYPDRAAREREIRQIAADWARDWDANSLVILRRATIGFDTVKDFAKIRAKVLYVLCRSDVLFPPTLAPRVMKDLTAAGVEARYFELDSDLGHSASGPEHAKWSPVLREFLAPSIANLA
jgi:homoserine O-acetyltransferase